MDSEHDVFAQVSHLEAHFRDLFDSFGLGGGSRYAERPFEPPTDVYETAEGYGIVMEVPGAQPESFDVQVDGQTVRVAGHKDDSCPQTGRRYLQMEIACGPFERSITLPRAIDPERVAAHYQDGVLRIEVATRPARGEGTWHVVIVRG